MTTEIVTGACIESLDLAKALGIKTDNLMGFKIEVDAKSIMTVQCMYQVEKGQVQRVTELLRISHAAMRRVKNPTAAPAPK